MSIVSRESRNGSFDDLLLGEGGALAAIGHTPLVRLRRVLPDIHFEIHAKLESLNPGGSSKDRPAALIVAEGVRSGAIGPNTTVIESSSGNLGIGLAQACAYFGLRFICVVDSKTSPQSIAIMRAFGAEVDVVRTPDPGTGELLPARLSRVRELLEECGDSFWPNQYANSRNPAAHHRTMREIATALDGRVDYVFCATSTCGTLRGCSEYVRAHGLATRLVAVDAAGSVIFGTPPGRRLLPGHGSAVRPGLFQPHLADQVVHVADLDCVVGCRSLVRREALLVGGSSGAVLMALHQLREQIPAGARCAAILPDRGERYLDTIYSDDWVRQHFGQLPDLLPGGS